MTMQAALTQREVSPAHATLATLEMESIAQVSYNALQFRHTVYLEIFVVKIFSWLPKTTKLLYTKLFLHE